MVKPSTLIKFTLKLYFFNLLFIQKKIIKCFNKYYFVLYLRIDSLFKKKENFDSQFFNLFNFIKKIQLFYFIKKLYCLIKKNSIKTSL
jgi:hypothetical protein